MVVIRYMHNYSSDHFALQARLLQRPNRCHGSYLWWRHVFTLSLPAPEEFRPADRKVQELKALEPTPTLLMHPPQPQCMSKTSVRLIDGRAALRCNIQHNRNVVRTLTKVVWRYLLLDSRRQAEKATDYIGACLEPVTGNPDPIGTYAAPKRWYRHASMRALNPSRADMAKVTGDYAALYRREERPPWDTGAYLHQTIKVQ